MRGYQRDAPPCFQESVSRQRLQGPDCHSPTELKCERTGDFLCDTEADPGQLGLVTGTTYTGGGYDHWGDAWVPNVFNIMSYAPPEITDFFSEGQIGVMQFWTTGGDSRLQQSKRINHQNNFIDIYEPDDVFSDASEIVLNGIPQTRGLHGIPNGPLNSPSFDYCNKDWVKFTLSETKKVSIRTQPIQSGMDEVNTSIELFGSDATTSLAFNDDINPDDFYTVILGVTLQPGDYYILIRNEGLSSGTYTLALEDCGIEGCCFQPLLTKTTTVTHGVNSPFNIGHKAASYEKIDRDIEVSNNLSGQEGVFGCNISSPIGNGHLPNSSLGSPTPNSHLFVDVCNYAEVSIDHSIFIIGDSDANLSSVVSFEEGTTLKLMSFGKLRISNNSKLIIEDGANFIFEEGAEIELLGPNSSLEIRGKLTIGNNADFTFMGDGRLIFDQDVKWATNSFGAPYLKMDDYMDIGTNTTFKVEGPSFSNMSHVLIEARKPVYFRTEDGATFKEVSIKYGRVMFHQNALLFSFSPTTIMWVHFNAANVNQTHGGFRLWHNSGPNYIMHSRFSNGSPAALIHWFGGGNPIALNSCEFDNNEKGLKILGGNFNLNLCDFNNNIWGLEATNLSGNCAINNSKFIGNSQSSQVGALLDGQSGTSVLVSTSEFSNNQEGLSFFSNINARVTCSDFTANQIGISTSFNCVLDIGDEAENVFVNVDKDISLNGNDESNAIFLNQGFNDFAAKNQSGGLYLWGYNTQIPAFLGGGTEIPADNNKMPTYNYGVHHNKMPVDFSYNANIPTSPLTTITVTLDIPNNLSSIQRDCTGDVYEDLGHSAHHRLVQSFSASGGLINSNSYPLTSLKAAALDAIDLISVGEEERDDAMALVRIIEILNSTVSQPDAYTNRIHSVVYQQMHQALSNAFQNGSLVNVQGEESNGVNDTVADAIAVIDSFISGKNPSDSTHQSFYFKYHLDKAHAYRVSGHYSLALSVLANAQNWTFTYAQSQRASYWTCVCDAEFAYYNEELAAEEFSHQIEICNQQFAGYNYKRSASEPVAGGGYVINPVTSMDLGLYPQPAANELILELTSEFEGKVPYSIETVA